MSTLKLKGIGHVMGLLSNIYYLWSLIIGAAAIVFGAGVVVEKTRTERFVTKELHAESLKTVDAKFDTIKVSLGDIKESLTKVTNWIDEVRTP